MSGPGAQATNAADNKKKKLSEYIKEYYVVTLGGMLLSFNAGYVNGCCLSGGLASDATKQSVAGFTGAYTTAALEAGGGGTGKDGLFQLYMILSFIAGLPLCKPVQIVTVSHLTT